ncbi:MAG TPA: GH3 auxin-responsive promoter family protein [Candidatus Absconditabacterales bacterium]|nr:GH3 auxin-responsive promoter family protein [Candidatus Absconditabacterales bacterium]
MIEDTVDKNITFLNGQPSRGSNFLYKVLEYTGKKNILEVWPNFELFFWGGMAVDLYRPQLQALFGGNKVKLYQAYNASEGFFAAQDSNFTDDMLLFTNHGVFYEFIPAAEYGKEDPTVLTLNQVETNKDYVILITNNSGLRRYVLGDTVKFTTLNPWRIKVSGRTKYYIDVVGECVTSDYTDKALLEACKQTDTIATDYMLAPITYSGGSIRGAYERIIEFTKAPKDDQEFARVLDKQLCNINSYYFDERYDTKVLGEPLVHCVKQGTFYEWMKNKNKLGGQHKVPKVSNERKNIDELLQIMN